MSNDQRKANKYGQKLRQVIVDGRAWDKDEIKAVKCFYPPSNGKYYWSFLIGDAWIMLTGRVKVVLE